MPDHPLPASGGSYLRAADGTLTPLQDEATVQPEPESQTPAKPAAKGGPKAPAKED